MATIRVAVVALAVAIAGTPWSTSTAAADPIPRSLVCKLPAKQKRLPATSRRGLVQHLRQYPQVGLATPRQRLRAERILAQLVDAATGGRWSNLRAAERAGFDTRTAPRRAGDRSVRYFHAERRQEPRRGAS